MQLRIITKKEVEIAELIKKELCKGVLLRLAR